MRVMEARAEEQRQARLRADAEWRKQQRQRELERSQVRQQKLRLCFALIIVSETLCAVAFCRSASQQLSDAGDLSVVQSLSRRA